MTVVNEEPSRQLVASYAPAARWLAWAVLVLLGGTGVVPFITVLVKATGDD